MFTSLGRDRTLLLLALVIAVAGFLALASGMPDMEMEEGGIIFEQVERPLLEQQTVETSSNAEGTTGPLSTGVIAAGLVILLFLLFLAYRYREIRYGVLGTALFSGALLFLVYLYNRFATPQEEQATDDQLITMAERAFEELPTEPPAWFDGMSLLVTIGILLIIVIAVLWVYRNMRVKPKPTLDVIGDEAQAALIQLRLGHDLRDTIARCYYDMNQALVRQLGLRRPEGMTPREFEEVLLEAGLPQEDVRSLTRLFEQVRYSADAVDESDQREAIRCLESIVNYSKRSGAQREARASASLSAVSSSLNQPG